MGLSTLLLWAGLAHAGAPTVNLGAPALQFSLTAVNEDIAMELVNKPTIALSDFVGVDPAYPRKATVLWFFSRANGGPDFAVLDRVARKYRGKGVQVVAISTDAAPIAALAEWVGQTGVSFPVLRDNHQLVSGRYGLTDMPVAYVLDGDGDVFAIGTPGGASLEEELASAIEAVLEDPQ